MHGAQPLHAQSLQGRLDRRVGVGQAAHPRVAHLARHAAAGRGDQVLRAGRRAVAVLEDQQHGIVVVEQRALHAGEQSVVPETAVAHDRQGAPLHHRRHAGAAGQAHAVAQDRMAHRERLEGAERVTADVGGDVHRTEFLLRQLQRGEHRPLRTADAKARRPVRQWLRELRGDGGAALAIGVKPGRAASMPPAAPSPARGRGLG